MYQNERMNRCCGGSSSSGGDCYCGVGGYVVTPFFPPYSVDILYQPTLSSGLIVAPCQPPLSPPPPPPPPPPYEQVLLQNLRRQRDRSRARLNKALAQAKRAVESSSSSSEDEEGLKGQHRRNKGRWAG